MQGTILEIVLRDNLERVSEDVSLVHIVRDMAKQEGVSPALLCRRLICSAPAFREEMARRMKGGK